MLLSEKQKIEKQEWIGLLRAINQLEIRGQGNVSILFNIIDFIQKKIKELDDLEKVEKEGG